MADDNDRDNSAYDYEPSKPAAAIFLTIYAILFLLHGWQAFRYRTFWAWPLIAGLFLEVIGYATRYVSILQQHQLWSAVTTQVAIIVAPAFMAAYIYMLVGRMMSYLGAEYSPISHNIITKIFVVADFISIFSQGGAGALLSSDDPATVKTGFHILVGALAFQVFLFMSFVGVTVVFDRRSRRGLGAKRQPIQPLFTCFYVTAALVILRSIYRLIEFATVEFTPTGANGYTLEHEWLLFVWDALPITFAVIALSVVHAGKYLPREKGLRLDGSYEEPSRRVCGCLWLSKSARRRKPESLAMSQVNGQDSTRQLNGTASSAV